MSVATVEFTDGDGDGATLLTYTEQGVYLDGLDRPEWRRGGVGTHLDHLARVLDSDEAGESS